MNENFEEARAAVKNIFTLAKAMLEELGVTVDMAPDGLQAWVQESGAGADASTSTWWSWDLWRVIEMPARPPGTLRVLYGEEPPHGSPREFQLRMRRKEHKQHREAERFVIALLTNGWSDQVQSVMLFQMMRKRVPHLGLTIRVDEGRNGFPERRVELYWGTLGATLCVADEGNADVRLWRGSFVEPKGAEGVGLRSGAQLLQYVVKSFADWICSSSVREEFDKARKGAEPKEDVSFKEVLRHILDLPFDASDGAILAATQALVRPKTVAVSIAPTLRLTPAQTRRPKTVASYPNARDTCDHTKQWCAPVPASPRWRWACMGCGHIYPEAPLGEE